MPQITVKGFTDQQMKNVTPALGQKLPPPLAARRTG